MTKTIKRIILRVSAGLFLVSAVVACNDQADAGTEINRDTIRPTTPPEPPSDTATVDSLMMPPMDTADTRPVKPGT